jgi:hypothetical protein
MDKDGTAKLQAEKDTVSAMIHIYCKGQHGTTEDLCVDCQELLDYADARLDKCPFGVDKPKCSACKVHCYQAEQRERIKDVMRYAGPRMILKHPVKAIGHALKGKGSRHAS